MSWHLKITLLILVIIAIYMFASQIKNKKLELKYSLAWFFILVIFIVVVAFSNIIIWVAHLIGVVDSTNGIFFIGFCVVFFLLFVGTIAISRCSVRIKAMAREHALLEKKYQELESKVRNENT